MRAIKKLIAYDTSLVGNTAKIADAILIGPPPPPKPWNNHKPFLLPHTNIWANLDVSITVYAINSSNSVVLPSADVPNHFTSINVIGLTQTNYPI